MRLFAAFVSVVLLWSTTPLAIKWSGESSGYLFGVASRMTIGLGGSLLLVAGLRRHLPVNSLACRVYCAGAVQIFGSMLATYWAAQFIPSGWISVVFGLTPLTTALLSAAWLGERGLTAIRLLAYGLGLAGLAALFGSALRTGSTAAPGIAGVLLASLLQAISSVWIKKLDAGFSPLALVTGSLLFAVPAYLVTWSYLDGSWPDAVPLKAMGSILYLGIIATPFGFGLYFYLLKNLPATKVALITLVTPVFSLLIGHAVNGEAVGLRVAVGTALILGALLLHEFAGGQRLASAEEIRRGER